MLLRIRTQRQTAQVGRRHMSRRISAIRQPQLRAMLVEDRREVILVFLRFERGFYELH